MIKRLIQTTLFLCLAVACNNHQTSIPNTDIDVARAFIKNILVNDFKNAEPLVYPDKTNKEYFDLFNAQYQQKSKTELESYKNADIIINEINNVNDSITIINYSNTYIKKAHSVLKMVKSNGQWMVDFKYTFSGNL